MKTPDQIVPYPEGEKMGTAEKKEIPQSILQILKDTAEKFRTLGQEAEVALHEKKDVKLFRQKLEERAQLLINLPNLLSGELEGIDPETKQRIMENITWFATSAQKAMGVEATLGLDALLTQYGSKIGDKNDLEKLIASLENK